jgi:hypothetical protein
MGGLKLRALQFRRLREDGRISGRSSLIHHPAGRFPVDELRAQNVARLQGGSGADRLAVLAEGDGKAALEGGLRAERAQQSAQANEPFPAAVNRVPARAFEAALKIG